MNPVSFLYAKVVGTVKRQFDSKKKLIRRGIHPVGVPTWNLYEGRIEKSDPNPDSFNAIINFRSEVIEPTPEDTIDTLCLKMSQAASNLEFPRVIVYPVGGELRKGIMEKMHAQEQLKISQESSGIWNSPVQYPMYEYYPANITNDDDLDAKTIIYKYKKTSDLKPI